MNLNTPKREVEAFQNFTSIQEVVFLSIPFLLTPPLAKTGGSRVNPLRIPAAVLVIVLLQTMVLNRLNCSSPSISSSS